MLKIRNFSFLFLWLFALQALALSSKNVVIISVDGLRPDAITQESAPIIYGLKERGVWALNARTIVPSITLPSHTSMLTGVDISVHKVDWNKYQKEKGVVKVPTCLEIARRAGKKTAMFVGKEKFRHLKRVGSLNHFEWPGLDSASVAKSFTQYVGKRGLPNLTFIHFPDTDVAGHAEGWMTPAYFEALKKVDVALGEVLSAISKSKAGANAAIILTADHGGKDKNHKDDIPEDRLIPWIVVHPSIKGPIDLAKPIMTYDTAATALKILGIKVPAKWAGKAIEL